MTSSELRDIEATIESARAKLWWLGPDEIDTLRKHLSSNVCDSVSEIGRALDAAAKRLHQAWLEAVRAETGLP